MYKRDRARKLQIMRQRQLAIQAIRGSLGGPGDVYGQGSTSPYPNLHIKQEIQIPQVGMIPIHEVIKFLYVKLLRSS